MDGLRNNEYDDDDDQGSSNQTFKHLVAIVSVSGPEKKEKKTRFQRLFQRLVFMAYLISFILAIYLDIAYSYLLLSWIYHFVPLLPLESVALNFSFVHAAISLLLCYNTFLFIDSFLLIFLFNQEATKTPEILFDGS